jgi:hypothetical protein
MCNLHIFSPDFPDIKKIVGESPFVLASIDELFDFPRPSSPRVFNIGGIALRDLSGELKTLNGTEFDAEMQKGKKGVVFFSLGSMVIRILQTMFIFLFQVPTMMLPQNVMPNILKAFANLKDYHFIVRVDKTDQVRSLI